MIVLLKTLDSPTHSIMKSGQFYFSCVAQINSSTSILVGSGATSVFSADSEEDRSKLDPVPNSSPLNWGD